LNPVTITRFGTSTPKFSQALSAATPMDSVAATIASGTVRDRYCCTVLYTSSKPSEGVRIVVTSVTLCHPAGIDLDIGSLRHQFRGEAARRYGFLGM